MGQAGGGQATLGLSIILPQQSGATDGETISAMAILTCAATGRAPGYLLRQPRPVVQPQRHIQDRLMSACPDIGTGALMAVRSNVMAVQLDEYSEFAQRQGNQGAVTNYARNKTPALLGTTKATWLLSTRLPRNTGGQSLALSRVSVPATSIKTSARTHDQSTITSIRSIVQPSSTWPVPRHRPARPLALA